MRKALGGKLFDGGVKRVHDPSINQKGRRPKPAPSTTAAPAECHSASRTTLLAVSAPASFFLYLIDRIPIR
jgi:hypothetical protein